MFLELAEGCQRGRSEATLAVQRREEPEKKLKKRTEAVRVIIVNQAFGTE